MSISATITAVNAPVRINDGAITAFLISCIGSVASLVLMTLSSPFAEAVAMMGQY
jgi:hypothetical protein